MATFHVASTPGAGRYTSNVETKYGIYNGRAGWDRSSYVNISYRTAVLFDVGDMSTEPAAADQSVGMLSLTLAHVIDGALAIGVLTGPLSGNAQTRYGEIGLNSGILGTLAAGSYYATVNLTTAQLRNAAKYGVRVFPATEFGDHTSYTTILGGDLGTALIYTPINPASKGRVSDLTPGNYASIVASEDTEIGYTYRQDYGGYAQAWLGVTAVNQDTGKNVLIARKKSVSVPDGGRGTFTIPAGTLSAGRWTITISAAPAASANYYADTDDFWVTGQEFVYTVRENPSASGVTCDGRPVPLVEWDSVSQAAYQVRFGDCDSGARAGTGASFVVPKIFRDGAYPVTVRTASSAGTWSAWTETEYVTVQNAEPAGDFSAQAEQEGVNMKLSWTAFSGAAHYAVFRDGAMIAVLDPSAEQFVDRIGAGGIYEVLAVTANRYYKSSGQIAGRLRLAADLISADGGYTWLAGRLTPERKSQPEDVREDISFVYYAGRDKPTAFRTGQKNRSKSFVYVFKNRIPARTLRSLVGSEVIVKTTRGEHIRGVIPEMGWGDARFVTPSFQIREIWGEEDGLEYPTA